MTTLPTVSIVTPSYNQGDFIRETIESVLTQEYPHLEYWVIDGGSTDRTLDILKEYETDSRFHWLSEPDQGQADAVNKGWTRCQGEVLGWLNSDDTYQPGAVTAQVQALVNCPGVDLVYGDAVYVDAQGKRVGRYHSRPFDRARFLHVSSIPQPSAFFRRSLLETYGGLDTQYHYALDFELFLRYMWHADFLYTGTLVATYRLHAASKTVDNYDQMLHETIEIVQANIEQHLQNDAIVKRNAVSDWYWCGAINQLNSGPGDQVWRYCRLAIQTAPLRPRMLSFLLKLFDTVFHANLFETVTDLLDQRAARHAKSPHHG